MYDESASHVQPCLRTRGRSLTCQSGPQQRGLGSLPKPQRHAHWAPAARSRRVPASSCPALLSRRTSFSLGQRPRALLQRRQRESRLQLRHQLGQFAPLLSAAEVLFLWRPMQPSLRSRTGWNRSPSREAGPPGRLLLPANFLTESTSF